MPIGLADIEVGLWPELHPGSSAMSGARHFYRKTECKLRFMASETIFSGVVDQ
jgi:hypothetical protein